MPRFDGTGPTGAGSGTGRALGPCGAGMRRGQGFRNRAVAGGGYISPKNQQAALEAEKEQLEAELETINEELDTVKKDLNK